WSWRSAVASRLAWLYRSRTQAQQPSSRFPQSWPQGSLGSLSFSTKLTASPRAESPSPDGQKFQKLAGTKRHESMTLDAVEIVRQIHHRVGQLPRLGERGLVRFYSGSVPRLERGVLAGGSRGGAAILAPRG